MFQIGDEVVKSKRYSLDKYCLYGGEEISVPEGTKGVIVGFIGGGSGGCAVSFTNGVQWSVHSSELELAVSSSKTTVTQTKGATMIFQIAIEAVNRATNTVSERTEVLIQPTSISAADEREAILKIGVNNAKAIAESKADYLRVTAKSF